MKIILFVLMVISGSHQTTTTTVVGKYDEATCLAMMQRHNRIMQATSGSTTTLVRPWSVAYCNAEKADQ
jgi:hypothetical protein